MSPEEGRKALDELAHMQHGSGREPLPVWVLWTVVIGLTVMSLGALGIGVVALTNRSDIKQNSMGVKRLDKKATGTAQKAKGTEQSLAKTQGCLTVVPSKDAQSCLDRAAGVRGPGGATGATGLSGRRGLMGITGAKGEKGDKGDPCNPSVTPICRGPQGDKGEKGDPGNDGAPSQISGPQGLNGPAGARGEKGEKGDRGEKGEKGDPGTPGVGGAPGVPGADGAPGSPGSLVLSVEQCQVGEIATDPDLDGHFTCPAPVPVP